MKKILLLLSLFACVLAHGQDKVWTLKECIDLALQKNVILNTNRVGNEINEINAKQAMYARLPSLNASGSQNYQFGRSIDPSTNTFTTQTVATNNFGLTSNVILFNGFQQVNTVRQNRQLYESGKLDIEKLNNDLIMNVTAAYLQILFSYELVDNAKILLENDQAQADRTQKLVDAGSTPELMLLQLKSQIASDKLTLATYENQLAIAKVTLMQYMELAVVTGFEVERPQLPEPDLQASTMPGGEDIYTTALANQPQIKSYAIKKRSSMMGVKIAQGAYSPRLNLSGQLTSFYSSANSLAYISGMNRNLVGVVDNTSQQVYATVPVFGKQDYPFFNQLKDKIGESVSLTLAIPIVNGRQVRSSVERAKVNYRIAELNEQNTKNLLRKSIEQSVADLKAAQNKYVAAKEGIKASELSFQNSEKRFSVGLANATDFLIQKNLYFSAKTTLAQAKYDYFFKTKVLEFYQGKPISF